MSNTDATRFTGITFSDNTINNHGRGGYFFSTTASTVTGNTFMPSALTHYALRRVHERRRRLEHQHHDRPQRGRVRDVVVRQRADSSTIRPRPGITIIRNNLQGLADGISSNATATVDGTCNWWGSASSGPTPGQLAGGGP